MTFVQRLPTCKTQDSGCRRTSLAKVMHLDLNLEQTYLLFISEKCISFRKQFVAVFRMVHMEDVVLFANMRRDSAVKFVQKNLNYY